MQVVQNIPWVVSYVLTKSGLFVNTVNPPELPICGVHQIELIFPSIENILLHLSEYSVIGMA